MKTKVTSTRIILVDDIFEEVIPQEDIDEDNACFDAYERELEESAAAWDARHSREAQDRYFELFSCNR